MIFNVKAIKGCAIMIKTITLMLLMRTHDFDVKTRIWLKTMELGIKAMK